MSLYFVSKPPIEGTVVDDAVEAHARQPLIASVWCNPSFVLIMEKDGDVLAILNESGGGAAAAQKALTITCIAWHPTLKLLAVGWSSGKLSLWAMADVESIDVDGGRSKTYVGDTTRTTFLKLSARAAIHSDVGGAVQEHNAGSVIHCKWSTNGHYLLTTSQEKQLVLWELERGTTSKPFSTSGAVYQLKPLLSQETPVPITLAFHAVSAEQQLGTHSQPNGAYSGEGNRSLNNDGPPSDMAESENTSSVADLEDVGGDDLTFLLVGGANTIYSINEEQQLNSCITYDSNIAAILYDPLERMLVTLSTSQMLEVHRISCDLIAAPAVRRKLPITPPPGSLAAGPSMAWAGPKGVAICCGDSRVHIFDFRSDVLYSLPFPTDGVSVTSVAADRAKSLLALGTAEGAVAILQYNPAGAQRAHGNRRPCVNAFGSLLPGSGATDTEDNWELVGSHAVDQQATRIVFSSSGSLAVSTSDHRLAVMHESIRKRGWDGIAAATQISMDTVVIESITGFQCLLKIKNRIRGLSIAFPYIALWNGMQIDLYLINETTSGFTLINFVLSDSPAFALHREGLLYVKENSVAFVSLQLQPIAQLDFTEAEGVPILLDVMNDFMVAVSSKNVMRLARISSRDLRSVGPPRQLNFVETPPVGSALPNSSKRGSTASAPPKGPITVVAARVNAQGRRVALMTTVGVIAVPDTRVWVYDSDTDKVSSFNFANRNEIPDVLYWNTPEPNANTIGELEYLLLACETHSSRTGSTRSTHEAAAAARTSSSAADNRVTRRDDVKEAMPDMENFADTKNQPADGSLQKANTLCNREHNIVTFFATRNGLAVHNTVSLKPYQICLVGLSIPDFLLASVKINGNPSDPEDYVIEQKRLRDFEGLRSDKDVAVREALMKFSYYATIGNMDEAYRCIKLIKNPAAWQGLARMCVLNGQLDVAQVCLATVQDGIAARFLREAREEYPKEKKVQQAFLACSLGMTAECEHLLRAAKRNDLITDVYLACGKFEQAQRHSERHDRIHIRQVAYKYAQFMESLQNTDAAIMWYYNSRCVGTDVARLYYQFNRLAELRELIMPSTATNQDENGASEAGKEEVASGPQKAFRTLFSNNRELLLWWAKQSERHRNLPEAMRFYHAARDIFNVVRLMCNLNPPKIDTALDIVNGEIELSKMNFQRMQAMAPSSESGSRGLPSGPQSVGAAYFIGKHFEKTGDTDKSLRYYRHAGAYHSAVRLAQAMNRVGEVLNFSLVSGDTRLMLDSAIFLEKQRNYDGAVTLYRRVGATQCALDVCIKGGLFDTLHEISTCLANASADPEVFLNMARHFESLGQHQKSVEMLVFAKRYDEALAMCTERNVTLTEGMAEAMTGENNSLPKDQKVALLNKVARVARDQGSWNLACKKYTQAGERMKAMKMLMRGGDVDKVIFFANHSRNAEIFTLAGNFLQSQNWSDNPKVYEHIVLFYTKAKAFENLASFYDSCANIQIDENRNYRAALRVVEACVHMLEKATQGNSDLGPARLPSALKRLEILRAFVRAQHLVDSIDASNAQSPDEKKKGDGCISICSDIIKRSRPNSPDQSLIEEALRVGDVFALLINLYFLKLGEPKNALKVLESMPKHGAEPQYFVERDVIENVCTACGKRLVDVVPNVDQTIPAAEGRRRSSASQDRRVSLLENEIQ